MNTVARLGVYALGLAVAFAGAAGLGRAVGPLEAAQPANGGHGGHAESAPGAAAAVPGGLQIADAGLRLVVDSPPPPVGRAAPVAFRVLRGDGQPLTGYRTTHDKELHLILVRRDLTGFQHLHPVRDAAGTWRTEAVIAEAGQYRLFADFQPADRDKPLTLGVDLPVPGVFQPRPLPAATTVSEVDGYRVELHGQLTPGTASGVQLRVTRAGAPVTDLQPYLGAYGHLVALRDGDLAYLHVHPDGEPGDGRTPAGPGIDFVAEVPSAGTYGLFLDFRHGDRVHTAAFTVTAGTPAPTPAAPPTGHHGARGTR